MTATLQEAFTTSPYPDVSPYEALLENSAAAAIWHELEPLSVLSTEPSVRRDRFYEVVRETPLLAVPSRLLPEDLRDSGYTVVVKHEGRQRSKSYKLRGVTNALDGEERLQTAVFVSTGNHGNAGAVAGRLLGFAGVEVECPEGTAAPKQLGMLKNGATVNAIHASLPDAVDYGMTKGEQPGYISVHPYDQVNVVAAQGTLTLEAIAQLEALGHSDDAVTCFYPGGGGGCGAGNAVAAKTNRPGTEVRLSQMWGAHAIAAELYDLPFAAEDIDRSCDGAAVPIPGRLPMQVIRDANFVDAVDIVSNGQVGEAMSVLASVHEVPEPAGALALAAALQYMRDNPRDPADTRPHVLMAVTSGIMVTPQKVGHFMQAALAEGRISGSTAARTVSKAYGERSVDGLEEILATQAEATAKNEVALAAIGMHVVRSCV